MVPRVSEEHMCLHGKTNWWKNSRNKKGSPTEVDILRHPGTRRGTIPCSTTQVNILRHHISKTLWIRHHPYIWQHLWNGLPEPSTNNYAGFSRLQPVVVRHCKWRHVCSHQSSKQQNRHLGNYLVVLYNVQKNTTRRKSRSTVVELFPYSSALVSYSAWRRRRIRIRRRRNVENILDAFHALSRIHVEEGLALPSVQSVLPPRRFQ